MMVLVVYDVGTTSNGGAKRLRTIAKICQNCGQRVQGSTFECLVDPTQWEKLKQKLLENYSPDFDSLRFYFLGKNWKNRVEHHGSKPGYDIEGPLIF